MARQSTLTLDPDSPVNPEEVLRRLELNITRRLDGILHGEFRGFVPGHGSEPGEAREYQPGDDVRRMDWNVTARLGSPHVRDQIADRELEAWMCVDLSASLDFGTVKWEKRELALAAAASVGFLAARAGNRVGAVLDHGLTPTTIPARQGRKHLLGILRQIQMAERQAAEVPTSLGRAFDRAAKVAGRRGMVTVISDFIDPVESWKRTLGVLQQRHEVLTIEVVDPREIELPNIGLVTMVDPETGRRIEVNTSNAKIRARYHEEASEQRDAIATAIRAAGCDHIRLSTDSDWLLDIVRHISQKRRLRAQVGGTTK